MVNAKSGSATARQVEALVKPVLEEMGLRLWDVRFEKEGPDWFLRIFIDRDTPLDMDTCEAATRAIDPVIDAADPIDQSYYMEVGSPGLGRRLTRPEHFDALMGRKIMAHMIRPDEIGVRDYTGILLEKNGNMVTVRTDTTVVTFDLNGASFVKLCDDDDIF